MVGAVIGDCLGSPVECQYWDGISRDAVKKRFQMYKKDSKATYKYTDDTAMARQVADSIISMRSVDAKDLAERHTREYYKEPRRGYGASVSEVFRKLRQDDCSDPFAPASEQFNGSGSFGNGAAMRVHPVGLYCHEKSNDVITEEVKRSAHVTHTHPDGVNGAIWQAGMVSWALQGLNVETLLEKSAQLGSTFDKPDDQDDLNYLQQLDLIKSLIKDGGDHSNDLQLGNDVSAIKSVPAAIYAFLCCANNIPELTDDDGEEETSPFEKTLRLAMTFGGDADTIMSMSGAIAGAYYGETGIPEYMVRICEGTINAQRQGEQLHKIVTL